jgi:hypothetical protein
MGDGHEPTGADMQAEGLEAELALYREANARLRVENMRLREFVADLHNGPCLEIEDVIVEAVEAWRRKTRASCRNALKRGEAA